MRNLDLLIPRSEKPTERWTWATVTQASPLRIRLDGESAALSITPENLAGALVAGERVWVQVSGRRTLVVARAGGMGVPTGTVQMFMGTTVPDGWLLLDGSTFDANEYPALADVLGTTTLPNMGDHFPIHTNDPLDVGRLGGSNTITEANMPAHDHSINHDHANTGSAGHHNHSIMFEAWQSTTTTGSDWRVVDVQNGNGANGPNYNTTTGSDGSHTHNVPAYSGNSGSAGSGTAYWQPFMSLNFIIKT